MSWLITGSQPIPAVIGESFGGGYFAGYISHTADGNPTHALIVAPRATGASGTGYTLTTNYTWKTAATTTAGTTSAFDGVANTAAMVTAGIADHPAAQFCVGLNIGSFTDWYLPSRLELDIAYFNLKPTVELNATTTSLGVTSGVNNYSVPNRLSGWSSSNPTMTTIGAFESAGAQGFVAGSHISSTETSSTQFTRYSMNNGQQLPNAGKTSPDLVRAFRRIAL
jgi:hypothetical protein